LDTRPSQVKFTVKLKVNDMAALEALYLQDPFWLWLGAGCLFVSLNLATGSGLLMWPAMAAAVVALMELVGLRPGLTVEVGVFAVLSLGAGAVLVSRNPRTQVAAGPGDALRRPPRSGRTASGLQDQTGRLVGRIGRSSGEFINGVGRVWIDGAEWGAELDGGDEVLPEGVPVRVTKVIGGIRLQVHALTSG
jgi:membrane protein implicated in regulation of membrane protease activity